MLHEAFCKNCYREVSHADSNEFAAIVTHFIYRAFLRKNVSLSYFSKIVLSFKVVITYCVIKAVWDLGFHFNFHFPFTLVLISLNCHFKIDVDVLFLFTCKIYYL